MKLHTAEGAILDVEQVALDDAPVPKWILPAAISESEFATASLAPPCIVEHYLYADVGVLIAPGGTGNTMLRLYECICIVLGIPLFSLTVRKPGPVLILTAEDSREML